MVSIKYGRTSLRKFKDSLRCLKKWNIRFRFRRKEGDGQLLGHCEYDLSAKRALIYLAPCVWKSNKSSFNIFLFHEILHAAIGSIINNCEHNEESFIDDLCRISFGRYPKLK